MSLYIPYPIAMMKPPSVRRCLFERPTAEKQEKDFETQESRLFEPDAKVFREKWGLDPKTGTVVSGAEYECVPVDLSQESIPGFYTKGYARKPRPVQSIRREKLSIIATRLNFNGPKALKRKYSPENEVINFNGDENCEILFDESDSENKRVPVVGDVVITTNNRSSNCSSSTFSSNLDVSNSPISIPSRFLHNPRLVKSPALPDISPRSTDLCTPQQRPRNLTQKTIKDYLPCKKARFQEHK